MKYYLIAGEASGDLHASRLMEALKRRDNDARFRFIGGDLMAAACNDGAPFIHYREMAYMGFIPVLLHLRTILRNMRRTKEDIRQWQPDVVVLVDYPGFNLSIAKFVHAELQSQTSARPKGTLAEQGGARNLKSPKVCYYIAPKIWAWKEYRIKSIRRDVDELLSILPFEVAFFEGKHHYPIHYVGNPTYDEVREYCAEFDKQDSLQTEKRKTIAVLCGSRRQEIADNLPGMLSATDRLGDAYDVVIAGAPGIDHDYYARFTEGHRATVLPQGNTYALLHRAHAALVTSGTATLETALFHVPQVVCYATPLPRLMGWLRRHFLKVRYVSLVNLIADSEVVPELVADDFSTENISRHLQAILDGPQRETMLGGYRLVEQRLQPGNTTGTATTTALTAGTSADNAAQIIFNNRKVKTNDIQGKRHSCL